MKQLNPKPGRGWAWAIEDSNGSWVLYNWADSQKRWLPDHFSASDGKPSPEARRIHVAIVPMSEYIELVKNGR